MAARKASMLQVIEEQAQQIEKYKLKLRDVVVAHKALLEEKKALEQSLYALQNKKSSVDGISNPTNETEDAKQLAAVINSLQTITASKAAMETSFQADKKQMREEMEVNQRRCEELQQKVQKLETELEDWQSRTISLRQERDKEQADNRAIMKELQKLLEVERSQRFNLEQSLADLKKQKGEAQCKNIDKREKRISKLQNELEQARRQLELIEMAKKEPTPELGKLKDELRSLQIEHQTAIKTERERAEMVEERAKRQSVAQEERVRALESRLAELSASVGTYDRLRQQDQTEISKLKAHLASVSLNSVKEDILKQDEIAHNTDQVSERPSQPDDEPDLHVNCLEEISRLRKELVLREIEIKKKNQGGGENPAVDHLVRSLQERIRIITEEAKLREKQHSLEIDNWKHLLRTEKNRAKDTLLAAETDFRGRLNLLETQLQKLRERSMAMLEDKEQEIHSLQGTFQAFLPASRSKESSELPSLTSMRDGPRMLHYANELARREVDIAGLRRAKQNLEASLRELQRATAADKEAHREEKRNLLEEIARLERCHSRGDANLEYLKNVVLSFLVTNDAHAKRHMANAITAVLKFTPEEIDKVAKQAHNTWWVPASSTS